MHNPLRKVATVVLGLVMLALGLMFSVVILAVLAVAAVAAWGYLFWKTRHIRAQLRQAAAAHPESADFIEGEATVVETTLVLPDPDVPRPQATTIQDFPRSP
jgi:hypothetical protein